MNTKHATPKSSRPYMPGYGILNASEGRGLLAWDWAVERLTKARNYWVATTCPDGRPHCVPVWGVWLDDAFYFSSGAYNPKYQWDLKLETVLDMGPMFVVRPRKVIAVDATPGEFQGSATRWQFGPN